MGMKGCPKTRETARWRRLKLLSLGVKKSMPLLKRPGAEGGGWAAVEMISA